MTPWLRMVVSGGVDDKDDEWELTMVNGVVDEGDG